MSIADELGGFGDDVRERSFDLATTGMDRAFGRAEEDLRSRLANQGINAGTEAFGAEMEAFNTGKGDAFSRALLAADDNAMRQRSGALGEALTQYNMDSTADLAQRQTPLNEISAILSGMPVNTINPGQAAMTNVAGTDVAGITNQNYANRLGAYNSQLAGRNATFGSLANLGGSALGAFF